MKMKKRILIKIMMIICFIFLVGCDLANTPTSQVEEYLSSYQRLDKKISLDESFLIQEKDLDEELKEEYQKLLKKQYRNLSYAIKNEEINGENATVVAEVTVLDYGKEIRNLEGEKDLDYAKNLLKRLKKVKKKITYTINFKVEQDENGKWKVKSLDRESQEKLVGISS